ncbi:MAG TPA: hypothetical protein VN113_07870, partial [Caulobacter sp.]|nr:hypothetical protein [Caulobacter sp.]
DEHDGGGREFGVLEACAGSAVAKPVVIPDKREARRSGIAGSSAFVAVPALRFAAAGMTVRV